MYPNAASHAKLLSAGGIAVLSSMLSAQGIIYVNSSFKVGYEGEFTHDWDIDFDGTVDAEIFLAGPIGNSFIEIRYGYHPSFFGLRVASNNYLQYLPRDTYVNGTQVRFDYQIHSVFRGGIFKSATGFPDGLPGYIGFFFDNDGTTNYGWAEVILRQEARYGSIEILRWAYDETGANIKTGAIPEPGVAALGLGALALGAAGLRRWRKKAA